MSMPDDGPEVAWFSALCDDDARQLGVSAPDLVSSFDHCSEIVRTAERRGIPFVWFPATGDDGDQVKDIRSGDQVAADPATWAPPIEDLRPQVLGLDKLDHRGVAQ